MHENWNPGSENQNPGFSGFEVLLFQNILLHSCPEALLRIKKITRTETYTGSLYDTWGVLKIFFKTFQLGNFEKSTNLCFPYAKLGAKLEENGHF